VPRLPLPGEHGRDPHARSPPGEEDILRRPGDCDNLWLRSSTGFARRSPGLTMGIGAALNDFLEVVDSWTREGRRVALATVVDVKRSAPQPSGTKMAVNDAGDLVGTVSGGCVERAVVQVAERILRGEEGPRRLDYGIADEDAWDVGVACGGEISIWAEVYAEGGPQARFTEIARRVAARRWSS
jgi:XdhC and CoxI family